MDGSRFDALTRVLNDSRSRRGALGILLVATGALGLGRGETAARNRNRKRPRRRQRGRRCVDCAGLSIGEGGDLENCDLSGQNLAGIDLSSANLAGACLANANLAAANLRAADLEGAGLRGAILVGANLRSADLERADLRDAVLIGADLSKSDVKHWKIGGALFCRTTMPDGTVNNLHCGIENSPCDVCATGCKYTSIQDAINAASGDTTFLICPGTYPGTLTIQGKSLTLVGTGTTHDQTIIDGQGQGPVVSISQSSVSINGVTIRGGSADNGGGVHNGFQGDLSLQDVGVRNNSASFRGGGVWNESNLSIFQSVVTGNSAGVDGGGIISAGTLNADNSDTITGNTPNNCVDVSGGNGCPD